MTHSSLTGLYNLPGTYYCYLFVLFPYSSLFPKVWKKMLRLRNVKTKGGTTRTTRTRTGFQIYQNGLSHLTPQKNHFGLHLLFTAAELPKEATMWWQWYIFYGRNQFIALTCQFFFKSTIYRIAVYALLYPHYLNYLQVSISTFFKHLLVSPLLSNPSVYKPRHIQHTGLLASFPFSNHTTNHQCNKVKIPCLLYSSNTH